MWGPPLWAEGHHSQPPGGEDSVTFVPRACDTIRMTLVESPRLVEGYGPFYTNRAMRRSRYRGVEAKHHGSKKPTPGREATLRTLIHLARKGAV